MTSRKQQKRIRRILFSAIAAVLLLVGGYRLFNWMNYRKAKFTRYPEFGISIPESYSIHGIDVSKYQSMIAWEEVRMMKVKNIQLGFAFVKATEGIGNTDPQFKRNWKRTKDYGIIRGAYHFFVGSKDGRMQAENFIDQVELEPGDMPPVLDAEQLNGASAGQLKKEIKKWLEIVENYYQVKPIIYTNVDFYNKNLGVEFDGYPLWVAHYYQTEQPRINRSWLFWQHSDEGRVNGIVSKVDFNVFNGDSLEFKNLLKD
ncbi:MAG: glycoside hydrolase family 25 protein [Chitinophagaceae bacterium]|nr:glycoside hydrolase family 25 protein [Chitinophagaceae bacterium]MBL0131334.1 glycoside hydrolase family 25 protein [Chitinophagaceae bacterium]MBL0274014.1 glycoside hydrolase family 25 protein [Chitinophagaceae bacterium]